MKYSIYLKRIYIFINYINNILRLPVLYNIMQNKLFTIKHYFNNISTKENINENENEDNISINDSDVENISDDSMFLEKEGDNKENVKESVLILSKY